MRQLETEAAQMQLSETTHENAACGTRDHSRPSAPPMAKQQLHPLKAENEGAFMSLPAWSGSAADSRVSRRQSLPQHVRSRGFTSHDSPLRRSSSYGMEGVYEPEYHSQESRAQLSRNPSPLRRGSASAYSDVETDSGAVSREAPPRTRRNRQSTNSQRSDSVPGRRTPVCFCTFPGLALVRHTDCC